MKLLKIGDRWIAQSTYTEKDIPKAAGFWWDPKEKCWWTKQPDIATKLAKYADEDIAEELNRIATERSASIQASKATTTVREYPSPEGLSYFPFQQAGIAYALNHKNTLIADEMGLGKFLSIETPVLTPDGWKLIGDMHVGNLVMGSDGLPHKVIGVYPQGRQEVYKVIFSDRTEVKAGLPHLWSVQNGNDRCRNKPYRILTTEQIKKRIHEGWSVPIAATMQFADKELPIPPYILGVLLGDGYLCGKSGGCSFVPGDEDVPIEVVKRLPSQFELHRIGNGSSTRYGICMKNNERYHPWTTWIKAVGLNVLGNKKFIPELYLWASTEDRWELLRGLMDSDGTTGGKRAIFCTSSKQLAIDVAHLSRSLGALAYVSGGKPSKHEGWLSMHGVHISHLSQSPFCARHKDFVSTFFRPKMIKAIEPAGAADCVCISVDSPDSLYVADGFILTHNTIQAIGVVNSLPGIKSALVICPASVKINWKRELERWLIRKMSIGIASSQNGFPEHDDVVICNYDILEKHHDLIMAHKWDLLIADECHYLKNPNAQRTKNVLGQWDKTTHQTISGIFQNADRALFLTGTPILNRPIELFSILHALNPQQFPNRWTYAKRYCGAYKGRFGWVMSGASNLDELQNRLRAGTMVRRLKCDVLPELPSKIRQVIEVSQNGHASLIQHEQASESKWTDLVAQAESEKDAADAEENKEKYILSVNKLRGLRQAMFNEMAELRHKTALAKVPDAIDFITEVLESKDKVLVYAHHHDVIDQLTKGLQKFNPVVLTGDNNITERQEAIDAFQNNEDVRVFIGSITAAGLGITLTAASTVVFVELDWVPANITQAEDRCHRIGQKNSVLVYHLVIDGSLDAKLARAIISKQQIADKALDLEPEHDDFVIPETVAKETPQKSAFVPIEDPTELAMLHKQLKFLAGLDTDRASTINQVGFNKYDSGIGHQLAICIRLTPRQGALAKKILKKYQKQLELAEDQIYGGK